ncbi:MAG: NAD(P)/FAD-dependent oxidoreductase [Verrucomicrobiales bacterium]
MKPVSIIGGGLAGLSLAAGLAKRRVPVTVHEAGSYPRHRVCGEFISGIDPKTLTDLGIAAELSDAQKHTSGEWFRQGRKILSMELPVAALGISRWTLDQRLSQRVKELGGEVITGERTELNHDAGTVLAHGRPSEKSAWLGLKCHVRNFPLTSGLEMHLGNNGYIGLTPVEDGRVNLCGLFAIDEECRGKGSQRLISYLEAGGHGDLVQRLEKADIDETSFTGVSALKLGWQPHQPGTIVLGDAGFIIPPFTGNGMSMAFESAAIATEPLSSWSRGKASWEDTAAGVMRQQHKAFRRRLHAALALQKLLLSSRGQDFFELLSRRRLMPFKPLLSLVR